MYRHMLKVSPQELEDAGTETAATKASKCLLYDEALAVHRSNATEAFVEYSSQLALLVPVVVSVRC